MAAFRETGPADAELEELYQALMGRRSFSYNAAEDPMYRSVADRYVQNGRLAMRDTMGSAAALTGGYGSSYAQAVGQQSFDEYLRQLSLLPACDPAAKAEKIRAFAETLFTTGGPAVDQVKALFGDEIARRLVCTHMYGV